MVEPVWNESCFCEVQVKVMGVVGFEPTRGIAPADFKSAASASSATPPKVQKQNRRRADSNRRIRDLQSPALPLGYASTEITIINLICKSLIIINKHKQNYFQQIPSPFYNSNGIKFPLRFNKVKFFFNHLINVFVCLRCLIKSRRRKIVNDSFHCLFNI